MSDQSPNEPLSTSGQNDAEAQSEAILEAYDEFEAGVEALEKQIWTINDSLLEGTEFKSGPIHIESPEEDSEPAA